MRTIDRKLNLFEADKTALYTLLCAVYERGVDNTYLTEQESVRQYFKTRYNFYCSVNVAHNIIIKCRESKNKNYDTFKKVVCTFREEKYKNCK
jgi:hypothetical protein